MTEKAAKADGLEATTTKNLKVRVGDVVAFGVRAPAGVRPEITPPDGPKLFVARDASGAWQGTWVPTTPGKHEITAGAEGHDPVVFTVDAAAREEF